MIRVTIDLDAFGQGTEIKRLAEIEIWNIGEGTRLRGDYEYVITGANKRVTKDGSIKDWPRTSKTAVQLLAAVLRDAGV